MNAFAALSDETRRKIVRLVATSGELTSTEISQNFDMTAPAISQHLRVLKEANVLQVKRDGQKRIYSISGSGVREIESWLLEIKSLWESRLKRLDRHLQKLNKEKSHGK